MSPMNANKRVKPEAPESLLKIKAHMQTFSDEATGLFQVGVPQTIMDFEAIITKKAKYAVQIVAITDGSLAGSDVEALVKKEYDELRTHVHLFLERIHTLKTWLNLLIPRVEDGNNFGVSVQELVLGELLKAEDQGFAALAGFSKGSLHRAKILGKMAKLNDGEMRDRAMAAYGQALREDDLSALEGIWYAWKHMHFLYIFLYDLMTKNMDKLLEPRSANTTNMY